MLAIYIEKDFITAFQQEYFDSITSTSIGQKTLYDLLVKYPETIWYIDVAIDIDKQLEQLNIEIPLTAKKSDYFGPLPVEEISLEYIDFTKHRSILVFAKENKSWFKEAEEKGALCFSLDNYEQKIEEIKESFEYRIDLSEDDFDWDELRFLEECNSIILNDNYILTDGPYQKMNKNLIPLLKKIVPRYE